MRLHHDREGKLVISVQDNGVGLPAERDRIIEPYMTTRPKGTGLGLAIVKTIVEEHFGELAFEDATRSEELCVGTQCVSTGRSEGCTYDNKKKNKTKKKK